MSNKKLEEYSNEFYSILNENLKLKDDFGLVLVKFLKFHKPNEEKDSLFCSIHKNFKKNHNCVACNLENTNQRIINFLFSYRTFFDTNTIFSIYILLLYLQVECLFEYLNIVQIPETYKLKNFQTLYTIKRWANFLKHPKSFLLVHHPDWRYENDGLGTINSEKNIIIDNAFINKYYKGDSLNKELYKILQKKENVIILFPNPVKLIDEFCIAQKKFKKLIDSNQIVIDILDDEATIEEYFEDENLK